MKIYYDPEADFLEVTFRKAVGYARETASEHVMLRVDEAGNVLGFQVLAVSKLQQQPLEVQLPTGVEAA